MRKKFSALFGSCVLLLLINFTAFAQDDWNFIDRQHIISFDSTTSNGYTLEFVNNDEGLDTGLKNRLETTFFKVYPEEAKMYNKSASTKVIFFMDTGYKGVAAASGNIVRFNPGWFHKSPRDIDVVTHEVMHIVQSYPEEAGPWWITEGIADYVRYAFGVDNAGGGWSLTPFSSKQHYDNGYRITARFLAWIEKNKYPGFVKKLDAAMRTKTYDAMIWKKLTGKTIDGLWEEYAKSPAL